MFGMPPLTICAQKQASNPQVQARTQSGPHPLGIGWYCGAATLDLLPWFLVEWGGAPCLGLVFLGQWRYLGANHLKPDSAY